MSTISPTQLRAILAQETSEVFLMCLTISHPSFISPYLLVTDTMPLVRSSGTFEPFAFSLNLPNQDDDSLPQVQLVIDNVDNKILLAIRNLPAGTRPNIVMEVVTASEPDTLVSGPIDFKMLSIDYDDGTITGTIGLEDDILNTAIPGSTYTPTNSPGLFI
ncbi:MULTISPECIES: DUF1833 family protein [Acidobacteriaceae]|uniref:DUF1833 family protein n=1 Tax=Acidobacteriaceae TaxID=204434 RepID=UPI00131C6359|nr:MULTISPECIES: DUF1833 family protein [Acidobacteriaceae]MDW5266923.1 DUF1833 family protein [Edaphobacter sp.]